MRRALRRERVVGGQEEDGTEGALDVDEDLVPESSEERERNRDRQSREREHADEDRPSRTRPEKVERALGRDRRPRGKHENDVAEQKGERELAVPAVDAIHAVETAEEGGNRAKSRAEHEVERERPRPRVGEDDRDARQAPIRPGEAVGERIRGEPESDRQDDQREEDERARGTDGRAPGSDEVASAGFLLFLDVTSRESPS